MTGRTIYMSHDVNRGSSIPVTIDIEKYEEPYERDNFKHLLGATKLTPNARPSVNANGKCLRFKLGENM